MHKFFSVFLTVFCFAFARAQRTITVLTWSGSSAAQHAVATRFALEGARQNGELWQQRSGFESGGDKILLVGEEHLADMLPSKEMAQWRQSVGPLKQRRKPEGFTVTSLDHGHLLVVAGVDDAGVLFGAGWVLRHLPAAGLPQPAAFFSAPDKAVRGYQVGYRMKNNTYDAWTLDQFEQQMWDMAVFGMNTIQVIAPISDDAQSSPLFHASPEEVVVGLSGLSRKYGLRYDLYYPEMAKIYADPVQVEAELKQFEDLVRRLPRVDSLHVPGGDPGHTAPEQLFPLVAKQAEILHRYHPQAQIWVSGQGFTPERFASFYALLKQQPAWLTGVFFGPQSRDGMAEERAQIPQRYPLEFYPDIGHTMHAQFPVPQWDPIFALTEGREPICPRPQQFTEIYRHFADSNTGFMVYSEGVNDDVNKVLWASLGWDRTKDPRQFMQEYSRYFLNAGVHADAYASAVLGLEKNWGSQLLAADSAIPATHRLFQSLHGPTGGNWRWHSLQYRDTYDRYVQVKRMREFAAEQRALRQLRTNDAASARVAAALMALHDTAPGTEEQALHATLEGLAATLFREVGLQLSVPKYGASNWERGANLDRIDTPLNDRVWLERRLARVAELDSERAKDSALALIAHWQVPPAGSFYDDLGDPAHEPHLMRGTPWLTDPEMYHAAIDGIADRTLEDGWRLSWLSYAETLYETPLKLHYADIDPLKRYRLKMTYAGEDYALPMQVEANGTVVQPLRARRSNPDELEVELPRNLTQTGSLTITWTRKPGAGGSGRGGQVAEVWLTPF